MNPDPEGAVVFDAERPRLLGLAYRLLGSIADAEDVCQEAWLRWSAADRTVIERPAAWLTTVTTRLALDRLTSAQHRRETYVGPWLPEPVVLTSSATAPSAEDTAMVAESLTFGFLAVLEQLDPVSRVVFVLADVFGMPFDEVATTVGRTPASTRQLAVRARRKVRAAAPHRPTPDRQGVVDRLFAAVLDGDVDATMAVLAEDVVLVSDGGPTRRAARRPVIGPDRVARLMVNLAGRFTTADTEIAPATYNGDPGLWMRSPAEGVATVSCTVVDDRIERIWIVRAPDKVLRPPTAVDLA